MAFIVALMTQAAFSEMKTVFVFWLKQVGSIFDTEVETSENGYNDSVCVCHTLFESYID